MKIIKIALPLIAVVAFGAPVLDQSLTNRFATTEDSLPETRVLARKLFGAHLAGNAAIRKAPAKKTAAAATKVRLAEAARAQR